MVPTDLRCLSLVSACATSALLFQGDKFTVVFPVAGNFKLVCLVHADMTGTIHVLDPSQSLPHDQAFYDREAQRESVDLLGDADVEELKHHHSQNNVTVGHGEIVATGGGSDTLSVMRFGEPDITVHAGDTVEWTNDDSITAHTVTFGPEPQDLVDPSSNVNIDADGARHGVLNSPSDAVHSGFYSGSSPGPQGARTGTDGSHPLPGDVQQAGTLSLYLLTPRRLGHERKGSRSSIDRLHFSGPIDGVPAGAVFRIRPLPPFPR